MTDSNTKKPTCIFFIKETGDKSTKSLVATYDMGFALLYININFKENFTQPRHILSLVQYNKQTLLYITEYSRSQIYFIQFNAVNLKV